MNDPDELMPVLRANLEVRDGRLYWLRQGIGKRRNLDRPAGHVDKRGYAHVYVHGKNYYQHRIIFALIHGYLPSEIDHINGDTSDNRPENLREVTHAQNMMNVGRQSNNTSGFPGIHWNWQRRKYDTYIHVGRKKIRLGEYRELELARFVRECAEEKYFGKFSASASRP